MGGLGLELGAMGRIGFADMGGLGLDIMGGLRLRLDAPSGPALGLGPPAYPARDDLSHETASTRLPDLGGRRT